MPPVLTLPGLARELQRMLSNKSCVLLAIDGYGGAGKTTLATKIQTQFQGSTIICLDHFAIDTVTGADRGRFLSEVLLPLRAGRTAQYRKFNWAERRLGEPMAVEAAGLVILEGVSVCGEDFAPYYDLRVWIDCPIEEASRRMMQRDTALGLDHFSYFNVWIKEDEDYGLTEPWNRVDYLISAKG